MFGEDDLLPISALAHLLFCERRAVLVHLEEAWEDNPFTVEGRQVHEKAHEAGSASVAQAHIARGLWLRSLTLGLVGKADVVEFHPGEESTDVVLPGLAGRWRVFPVEYKRGRRRHERGYEIQLCAQAMCLEEMLGVEICEGALYYAATHRRLEIEFDSALRAQTAAAAARLHELLSRGNTPLAEPGPKCESCSMANTSLPQRTDGQRSAARYLRLQMERSGKAE